MNGRLTYAIFLLVLLSLLHHPVESKKVVIHVPYRVKNVKHTHTVYKIIPHHTESKHSEEEDEKYDFFRK